MCGRYVLVQKLEVIEKRFNVEAPKGLEWKASYNISPGQSALVISSEYPNYIEKMQFGLTPFWAKKAMYLFNAREEGDRNKENNPSYSGAKDIINKPSFRKPIRSQRCLVIADAFIEGTTADGLDKPYLVYLKNKERPFAMAGIFDEWRNTKDGSVIRSFSIITTTSNALMLQLPHQRMPVILSKGQEQRWLNLKTPLADITKMLNSYDANLMNAYSISSEVSSSRNNYKELINPLSPPIYGENELRVDHSLHLQGMGSRKKLQ